MLDFNVVEIVEKITNRRINYIIIIRNAKKN